MLISAGDSHANLRYPLRGIHLRIRQRVLLAGAFSLKEATLHSIGEFQLESCEGTAIFVPYTTQLGLLAR